MAMLENLRVGGLPKDKRQTDGCACQCCQQRRGWSKTKRCAGPAREGVGK